MANSSEGNPNSDTISERSLDRRSLGEHWLDYQQQTQRPLVSLLFLLPLLLIYEVGVLNHATVTTRNGADVFLRFVLSSCGFDHAWLLPLLLAGGLLIWHHLSGDSWKIPFHSIGWMALECCLLATLLLLVSHGQRQIFLVQSIAAPEAVAEGSSSLLPDWLIAYLGAGIYEEFLFRMLLLPLSIVTLQHCLKNRKLAILFGIGLTSLLFSLAHHSPINFAGEPLQWQTAEGLYVFSFRFLAGAFFATLYLRRGIGIAIGAHATYDLIVHFSA